MKKKKEKIQTKKNQKQTKNEKTDYCNPSFYRNKREKRQKQNKTKETIRKTNQKSTYTFGEKKNLFVCQEENSARLLVMSTLIDPNQKKKNLN